MHLNSRDICTCWAMIVICGVFIKVTVISACFFKGFMCLLAYFEKNHAFNREVAWALELFSMACCSSFKVFCSMLWFESSHIYGFGEPVDLFCSPQLGTGSLGNKYVPAEWAQQVQTNSFIDTQNALYWLWCDVVKSEPFWICQHQTLHQTQSGCNNWCLLY